MKTHQFNLAGVFLLGVLGSAAHAERFEMESVILDSATAKALGGGKKSGNVATFFTAQKEMVYAALGDLGISLDSLPADIRKNLERYHTTNFEAFKMYSLGLNAQDQGKFAEAKAFFEKAVELDPNFQLAGELGFSMPNNNVTNSVQLQAVLAIAAKAATTSGKGLIEVDLAGAVAALMSGQTVVTISKADASLDTDGADNPGGDYTSNPPGASSQYVDRKVVGISYGTTNAGVSASVAFTNEWMNSQVSIDSAGLVQVDDATTKTPAAFKAERYTAADTKLGSLSLADGSTVSWGTWQSSPTTAFKVSSNGNAVPNLDSPFAYMIGQATRSMPTSATATFVPAGGFLTNVTGSIVVDFAQQSLQLNNLGFDIGKLSFSNLTGSARYSSAIASGFFTGNYYAGGTCSGCAAFSPTASAFTGNFLGNKSADDRIKSANGLMFSTVLSTGNGTVSGLHAFKQ